MDMKQPAPLAESLVKRGVSRRAVVRTAVWSAPAVAVVSAAPAYAFSGSSALQIASVTATVESFVSGTDYSRWSSSTGGTYTTTTTPPGTINPNAVLKVTVSGITATGSGSGAVTLTVKIPGQTDSSIRPASHYDTDAATSGWALAGSKPTINTTSRETTWSFVSATPLAVGTPAPNLTFKSLFSTTAGSAVYTQKAKTVTAALTSNDATATPSGNVSGSYTP